MNISLTPELEKFVQEKISSGMYTSASEVIRESLRLLHTYEVLQQQRLRELNNLIDDGLQALELGNKNQASQSYVKLKKKINTISKDKK